jgi:hypothetical protein
MLIEVHIIQNHAPSNLNRDESGSPKTAYFGGYRRARISSQCLKRAYRTSKTFREEVDGLGMHTRSMPDEIKTRLFAHADTLTAPEQKELQTKFREWAEKSQAKLAAILGKTVKETGGEESEEADESAALDTEEEASTEVSETGKKGKYQTAQSIFWRDGEMQTLFDAYRERIEWDCDVPEIMRNAFDDKGKVKPKDIIKTIDNNVNGTLGEKIKQIKTMYSKVNNELDEKFKAPSQETETKKKEREKKLKDAKTKSIENTANVLVQLILERFDPRVALKEAGLRPDGIPVDMALFGRMVTSDLMHNVDASSQFAHAISTHEFTREFDLWTRIDDRRDKRLDWYLDAFGAEEKLPTGTDGMGDAEFTAACFYNYFNVDFDALIDNLTGKAINHKLSVSEEDQKKAKERACNAVVGLLKAAIFERPTGKFNSMASPTLPTLILVEVRNSHIPVCYVDAFAKPVDPKNEESLSDTGQVQHVDLAIESAKRLIQEANRITKAFSRTAVSQLLFTGEKQIGKPLEGIKTAPDCSVTTVCDLVIKLRDALGCPVEKKDE